MGGPTEFSPTEFSKFVAFASAQSVAVVPHGGGVYGYYMAMAFEHIRLAEFMMISESADKFEPNFGKVFNRNEINLIRPYDRPTRPAGIS